jgi:hypothetical protein
MKKDGTTCGKVLNGLSNLTYLKKKKSKLPTYIQSMSKSCVI